MKTKKKLRKRIRQLEQRLGALERDIYCRQWNMPPSVGIDMDPGEPIATMPDPIPDIGYGDDWKSGGYL